MWHLKNYNNREKGVKSNTFFRLASYFSKVLLSVKNDFCRHCCIIQYFTCVQIFCKLLSCSDCNYGAGGRRLGRSLQPVGCHHQLHVVASWSLSKLCWLLFLTENVSSNLPALNSEAKSPLSQPEKLPNSFTFSLSLPMAKSLQTYESLLTWSTTGSLPWSLRDHIQKWGSDGVAWMEMCQN